MPAEEITFDQPTDTAVAEAPAVEEKPPEGEVGQEQETPEGEEKQRDDKGRFKGVQTRIDELTRARHEAEREAAYWRGLADQSKAKPAAPDTAAKPTPESFTDYSAYVEALAEWKADLRVAEALSKRDAEAQRTREQSERQSKVETFESRREEYRKAQPDFDEVMNAANFDVSPAVLEVIQDSESGPALARHLALNPDEAVRISKLSPMATARELGKIEASLSTAKPVQKSVTKAPAPITPVGSGRSATPDVANMSQAEYEAFRGKQGAWWAR